MQKLDNYPYFAIIYSDYGLRYVIIIGKNVNSGYFYWAVYFSKAVTKINIDYTYSYNLYRMPTIIIISKRMKMT